MLISVIISNLNGQRFLPRLLETLRVQRGVDLEIIVVDRHSTDGSLEFLAKQCGVKVVSEPPATGLVCGYHRGFKESTGEFLFFCNEDMWFDPDCLQLLAKQIDLPGRIGAADPWQWSYDGSVWLRGGTRVRRVPWEINGVHPFYDFNATVDLTDGSVVPWACAGALLIHRAVYEEIGGWDTSLFLDNEDIDMFLRAWQREWKTVVAPGAKVYHAVGMSNTGKVLPSGRRAIGRKRYIANRMGKTLIAWKYFSFRHAVFLGCGAWLVMFANNVVKCRFTLVSWDIAVLGELLRRLPGIAQFRSLNANLNLARPGQTFFSDSRFRFSAQPTP
jgi:GT2 family glycosyltransferase